MNKYNVKVFDGDNTVVSAILPMEDIYAFVDSFMNKFTVKVYMLTDE